MLNAYELTIVKLAPPFREGKFRIYYDMRKVDPLFELIDVILTQGLIPRYDAKGALNPKGQTYKYSLEDEELKSTKDGLGDALRKCPKIQQHFIDMIKNGDFTEAQPVEKDIFDNIEEENDSMFDEGAEEIVSQEWDGI